MTTISILTLLVSGCGVPALAPSVPGKEPNRPEGWQMDRLPARQESVRKEGLVAQFYYPARSNPPWPAIILLGGIALIGGSKGGELALLLASGDPRRRCATRSSRRSKSSDSHILSAISNCGCSKPNHGNRRLPAGSRVHRI